ncbi:MAG: hypothetical protein DHS20C12_16400 [Pseudohongiella sp.]|nr:MAG: hypothetical protein DHS20C12_16400 [Pseudohongiella sp.]
MKRDYFKSMWEKMQKEGYFQNHADYSDHFGQEPSHDERVMDAKLLELDFLEDEIFMPFAYSQELERSVKRTESKWLYEMFQLPTSGVALDLGCGFGRTTSWMAERYEKVIASDISTVVIEEAKRNLKALHNIEFCVNDADSIPAEVGNNTLNLAYVFTVFQHIHRDFAASILKELAAALKPEGKVVFNLLSDINEQVDDGAENTEWIIGYSKKQAVALVENSGLKLDRLVRWYRPENEVSWLWVCAQSIG